MRKLALVIASAVFVLGTHGGCGGNDDEAEKTQPQPQAQTSVVEVKGEPETTTPLAEVQEASVAVPGSPDWTTVHGGFVWVKRDDGIVTRVDPRTNTPRGEVRADTKSDQFCQGIGSGGGAIWSCSGSDVVRIDPKQLKVVASIPVGKVFDQGRLVFAGGKIWVISGEGDRLVGIDTTSNTVGAPIELPAACSELGPGPDTVWVLCPNTDTVLAVDPVEVSITGQFELASPSAAFGTETDVWVGYEDGLARVDVESLEPVARFLSIGPGVGGDVMVDGDDVWVRTGTGFLHRIDAASNTVVEQIEPEDALSGGAVVVEAGSLWTTAYDNNVLLRLRPGG